MPTLDQRQAGLVADCINYFGDGDHPAAAPDNVQHFSLAYQKECVKRALASDKLSAEGERAASAVLAQFAN